MNSTIDKHISQLLFDHECVIVPNFGAFIIREYSAEINAATHMLRPATKRVSFNTSIKENDGLLAKFISTKESVSYSQAVDSIAISVRSWKRMLKAGKKVNLPGIGRLYMDNELKLQFNPAIEINYNKHAYGLNIFRAPAIQREMQIEQAIHEAIEEHIPSKTKAEKQRRALPIFFRAAVVTAFLGVSITAGVYFSDANNRLNAMSGINPWSFIGSSSSANSANDDKIEEAIPTSIVKEDLNSLPEKHESKELKEDEAKDEPKTTELKTESPVKNTKTEASSVRAKPINNPIKVANILAKNSYHIVVGSFKEASNANKYINELQARGYEAYIAKGQNNFSRVAIGNYHTSDSAREKLVLIKNELNPGAWVYRN